MKKMFLEDNQEIRTITVRIKDKKDKNKLLKKLLDYRHFENILLILIQQNYDLYKQGLDVNDFAKLCNYRVIRALISGTKGGKEQQDVEYIREKYKDNKLFQQLIEQGKKLKTHNIAMIVKRVKASYKSFFTKISSGDNKAKAPKPKKLANVTGYSLPLDVNGWTIKKKNHVGINLDKAMLYLYFKHNALLDLIDSFEKIQAITVVLKNGEIYLKISYKHDLIEPQKQTAKYAGLDIGVNNLGAIYIHDLVHKSIIICGKKFKHYNAQFNRFIAKLNHDIDKLKTQLKKQHNPSAQKRLQELKRFRRFLFEKRNRFFEDQFHKISTRLLEYLQKCGVTVLYLSRNLAELKNNGKCQMRKDSKQSFIQIPFIKLLDYLQYKAFEYGIRVVDIDEAYTSKTSALSGNVVKVQQKVSKNIPILTNEFVGTRVKRGLFKDKRLKVVINADLNAALNIVKVGLQKNIRSISLFKLCNPVKFKSDWELVSFTNTVSDKTPLKV